MNRGPGPGELISTLADMKVWAKDCATGALLSPALRKQHLTWVRLPPLTPGHAYALGVSNNHGWIGHNGSTAGYTSDVVYLPSQRAMIVVLASLDIEVDKETPADALLHALTQIVTPQNVTI